MLRKSSLENAFDVKFVQNVTLKANAQKIRHFKMHLAPNMYKIITLNANAKEIVTLKCHLAPHMYKIITLKANAKKIIT